MNDEIFTIESKALPPGAHVLCFRGIEALSKPYRFAVGLQLDASAMVDLASLVGTRATLSVHLQREIVPYRFHGIVASCELVHQWQGKAAYRLVLVPELWRSTLTRHSRVFVEETIPAILEQVLRASGLAAADFDLRLSGKYEPHEFVAQYKESNFAFVSRWMEREGMYYFFEQGDDRERLIITDELGHHTDQPGAAVQYVPLSGGQQDVTTSQGFDSFVAKHQAVPAKVALVDYDYLHPNLDLSGHADVAGGLGGEISLHGENFSTPGQASRYARLRAEELTARRELYFASGRVFHLRPGYRFHLEEHPRPDFNSSYLTVELEHHGNQSASSKLLKQLFEVQYDDEYQCSLTAMPASVQFRAPSATRWPRIYGYEGAVVCGAAQSDYAQIDDHGRYRVRVMFDESDLSDGEASAWVRMLQPHGGGTEGFHFPLRKGTEVLLFFEGGDPDQPAISGVVPNAVTPSPVQAASHTKNVIQTGGANRLELEDSGGSQYIDLSSPTQDTFLHLGAAGAGRAGSGASFVSSTQGRWEQYSLGDRHLQVDSFSEEEVAGYVKQTYGDTLTTVVSGAVAQTYGDTYAQVVDGAVSVHYKAALDETVESSVAQAYNATLDQTIAGPVTISIAADLQVQVGGATSISTQVIDERHGGDKTTEIAGVHSVTATGAQSVKSLASQTIAAPEQSFTADGHQELSATTHDVDATSAVNISAPAVTVTSFGSLLCEGGDQTLQGASLATDHGAVSISGGSISVDGGGSIEMSAGVIKLN
ncbi:MAG: type VI secretion system tip protein VgrG [Deltaproteobacteria bacterium]|jgi:type VI secretion system secreted protein VgrG|nr:type VI secretion system tip protein VgrG [Deltaproteobacteria bacterium]MBW2535428.1 type VI secretion system tip protein VgrG [Deltaproteobacteria bacterium]